MMYEEAQRQYSEAAIMLPRSKKDFLASFLATIGFGRIEMISKPRLLRFSMFLRPISVISSGMQLMRSGLRPSFSFAYTAWNVESFPPDTPMMQS